MRVVESGFEQCPENHYTVLEPFHVFEVDGDPVGIWMRVKVADNPEYFIQIQLDHTDKKWFKALAEHVETRTAFLGLGQ